jgi:Mrp family chromosome partitioning ATPase
VNPQGGVLRTSLIGALWRHRWLVVLGACLGAALGWTAPGLRNDRYVSSTEIVLDFSASSLFGGSDSVSNPDRLVLDELTRFQSPDVVARTAALAGITEDQVRGRVDVAPSLDHNALTISAEAQNAQAAADLADDAVQAYQDVVAASRTARDEQVTAALTTYRDGLQAELDQLDEAIAQRRQEIHDYVATQVDDPVLLGPEVERASALDDQLSNLVANRTDRTSQLLDADALLRQRQIDASVRTSGIALQLPAEVPDSPTGARPERYAVLGAALGLVLAGVVAVSRSERRRIVSTSGEVATVLGARSLGILPSLGLAASVRASGPPDTASHLAAGAVEAAIRRADGRAVVVASIRNAEPSGAVALQLCRTMAQRGDSVLLIEAGAPVTRPRRAHAESARGFAEITDGMATLDDVLMEPVDLGGVSLVRGGRLALDPGALRSPALIGQLEVWRRRFDFVVVTGGPLIGSPVGVELAALTGCAVLVVAPGTAASDLEDVRELLDARDVEIGGFLFLSRRRLVRRGRRAPASRAPTRATEHPVIPELPHAPIDSQTSR